MTNRIRIAFATLSTALLLLLTAGSATASESSDGLDDLGGDLDGILDAVGELIRSVLGGIGL